MTTMTGGEAAVAALRALGVDTVFGIVSVHNIPILDAVSQTPGMELVGCRHEQGAVHAADGFARATGRLGVCVTSTGPGAANAMGGLYEASYASSPVLMLTGQVESYQYGRDRSALHQADQQLDMLRTVTKRSDHVADHGDIAGVVLVAAAEALSGRPGPAAVQIPIDLQYGRGEVGELAVIPPRLEAPEAALVDAAANLLDNAARPLIIAGGGVVRAGAGRQLTSLAERLVAPVLTTVEGRGSISEDHRLCLGPNTDLTAMDPVIAGADVVLAVGTRFQQNNNIHKWLTIPGRLVHLDADAAMIGRIHPAEVGLVGDACLGLEALQAAVAGPARDGTWSEDCGRIRDEAVAAGRESLGPDLLAIMDAMDEILPEGAIVAKDATVSAYQWGNRLLPVRQARSAMRPVSMAIGPGVPLAVGAAVGSGQPTVVIQGDGGLMLSLGELATAVQLDLPLVVCVFNDRGYGILRFIQDLVVEGRRTGVDLATPRFAPLAGAMGMRSAEVSDPDGFARAFSEAIAAGGPWLLDIDLTAMAPMTILPQRRPERT
ncbi:MAG: thiamine pyrophosphate-binding protein [Acidimicrobiaceae bacterium]|nr:thiamine pyrophosphate-binding protein [Acidimicrobiaceae bacterium]